MNSLHDTPATDDDSRGNLEDRFNLGALFEFSTIINASLELSFIFGHLLLTLMGKLLSLRGLVLLEKSDKVFTVETVKGLPRDIIGREMRVNACPQRILYIDKEDARKYPWIKIFREQGIYMVVPLTVRDRVVGLAGFGPSVTHKTLLAREETYVKSLANIAATAIEKALMIEELKSLNRRLDGKIQELNTLFELGKEFNSILDTDRLVKLLTFSIMGQIGAKRYFICMKRDEGMRVVGSRLDRPLSPELCEYFPNLNTPHLVEDMTHKQLKRFQTQLKELGIQVLVPFHLQQETKGVLGLGEKMRGGKYGQTDLEFISSLVNLAVISLENARLFKEAIEKQKLEDELLIAKEIQRGLLPARLPSIPHVDIAATNISSKQVGGDYYDFIPLDDRHFVIAIGDVSGKGTPASLLMANLQATIRALVPIGLSLSELTGRVNDLVCENTGSDRFITFFWGVLDTKGRNLRYVNAGHNPPYLFKPDGRIQRLDKGGIILGVMKTLVPYIEEEVRLGPGDTLILFTDGVTEAMNVAGDELGEERLEALARTRIGDSAQDILSSIVDLVRTHSTEAPQSDDITLLIVKTTE